MGLKLSRARCTLSSKCQVKTGAAMGKKMRNAPVYYTIAQVRHNPILSLESFIPDIQESMRREGYPDFQKGTSVVLHLGAANGGEIKPEHAQQQLRFERFTFSNMESSKSFILEQNALSYQATEYDTFEQFSDEFLKGLAVVHKAITLSFSTRIGIRYLDAVVPEGGEKNLPKYLIPEVLGLANSLGDDVTVAHSFSETLVSMPKGKVLSRTILQNGPLGFPPDIQPIGLKIAERFTKINEAHAVIDSDGSYEAREAFDIGLIEKKLDELHDEITKVFRAIVTPYALGVWK